MSYDLHFYRKNDQKEPFAKTELEEKLGQAFTYRIISEENGFVNEFAVRYKQEPPSNNNDLGEVEFFHQGNDKGYYWAYHSYSPSETLEKFRALVKDVAIALDLRIKDQQLSEDIVDPVAYDIEGSESIKRFKKVQEIAAKVVKNLPYVLVSQSNYFTLFLVTSLDPKTQEEVYLVIDDNKQYASKVEVGESLKQAVEKDVMKLTGSAEYKIISVTDFDFAYDRNGNKLPRMLVNVDIPYFDTGKTTSGLKLRWLPLKNS